MIRQFCDHCEGLVDPLSDRGLISVSWYGEDGDRTLTGDYCSAPCAVASINEIEMASLQSALEDVP